MKTQHGWRRGQIWNKRLRLSLLGLIRKTYRNLLSIQVGESSCIIKIHTTVIFVLLAASSVLLVFALLRQATAEESSLDSLTAKQIVKRMAEEYAKCKSYQDLGVVKTVFILPDLKRTVEKPFTTAFVRPDRFRFESRPTRNSRTARVIR